MAIFKGEPEEWQRLDWQILLNGAVSLYSNLRILEEAIKWFQENLYQIHIFDCRNWLSKEAFHADVSQRLSFPGSYGRNLDAFNDSLGDVEVPDVGGVALVFSRYDSFVMKFPQVAQTALDIVENNSRRFLLTGRRLVALVQSDNPAISFEPVGCHPVDWNPKERLEKKQRGL